jgi:hypothetical protein
MNIEKIEKQLDTINTIVDYAFDDLNGNAVFEEHAKNIIDMTEAIREELKK